MRDKFRGRDYLTVADYTLEEVNYILETSQDLKRLWTRNEPHELLRGRSAAMVFEKHSTRTRLSFQAACASLGMQSFYMTPADMQMARGESIKDTARVLDRYTDVLFIRTFGQEIVEEFARWMKNPVINALTDLTHPCQALADLQTIKEKKGGFKGLKLAYAGDIWNVCHSLMIAGGLTGMDVYVAGPKGYDPDPGIWEKAQALAKFSGATVKHSHDLGECIENADVVYTNTWHSMGGPEKTKEQRIEDFAPYQVTADVLKAARHDAIVMHCLPAYPGEEATEEVLEGPQSVVFDQAENRMHTEKALLTLLVT